ncbi:hypothetical protein BOTBODRAFT_165200 [Botryobasidium botryosum FD-172 SS1]|uniref:CBS domain-containing protein n=1 Tax=Botryobasidium botryosum (strain FD-172 SS1) TaxID=930990 RepID=A0A067M0R3_BOTB1|nr:hypothetical protein BOTBODRAFT_165200 [Botryobasidium botryosum FD-172 SS1]
MSSRRKTFASSARGEASDDAAPTPVPLWSQEPIWARDLVEEPVVSINGDAAVERACETLLSNEASCLVVYSIDGSDSSKSYDGLFDYADVNAYLNLAINANSLSPEDLERQQVEMIINNAKDGGDVPVRLACDLSEKNPMVVQTQNSTHLSLLREFSQGKHRVAIKNNAGEIEGIVSDRRLVQWLMTHAPSHPVLSATLQLPISELNIGSRMVISAPADSTIRDAMAMMSAEGVSSIAVVDHNGNLLSAVSVTDIGKLIVPSQSKSVLNTTLLQFISKIKEPEGLTDGAERYPAFSVVPSSTLGYTMQKILAINAHRVFITDDPNLPASPGGAPGNLRGVVSLVDILSVFARLAGIPNVDPGQMRLRRASSSSSSRSSRHKPSGSVG